MKKYIFIEDSKQEINYKSVNYLLQNPEGNELVIRLNSGVDYCCEVGNNGNVLVALRKYYFKNVDREIPVLKSPQTSLINCEKIEMKRKTFTLVDSSRLLGSLNTVSIENGVKLIYFRKAEMDLNSFTIVRELMKRGGETVYLVTHKGVERTMKVIEINEELYSFNPTYIANEAKKNVENLFVVQVELIYQGTKAIYIIIDFVQKTDLAEVLAIKKDLMKGIHVSMHIK
jgi:hypothetical protein